MLRVLRESGNFPFEEESRDPHPKIHNSSRNQETSSHSPLSRPNNPCSKKNPVYSSERSHMSLIYFFQ
uniref:Uncharacterized protein n=1 Tax=Manihot esculenta TaxID=3983 RepID=A0A2C9V562_MANES